MNKKNSNKTLFFTIFVILLTMVTLIATSGTYAKYTSQVSTSESGATVAIWEIKAGSDKNNLLSITGSSSPVSFDLFNTIMDSAHQGEDEEDIKGKVIAPGTYGEAKFYIKNESEVNVSYSINFIETNTNNIPIKFSLDGTKYFDSAEDLTDAMEEQLYAYNNPGQTETVRDENILPVITTEDGKTLKEITVYWKWAYEAPSDETSENKVAVDNKDIELGKIAYNASGATPTGTKPEYKVRAEITVTQID